MNGPSRVLRAAFKLGLQLTTPLVSRCFLVGYYFRRPWYTFLGAHLSQLPVDMHIYQELIFRTRPSFIVVTGVDQGGALLYFASMLDLIKADPAHLVVGIDIKLTERAAALHHPRIRLIEGSSTDPRVLERVKSMLPPGTGMVALDSDPSRHHVLAELRLYREFVGVGQYLVCQNTSLGHLIPVFKNRGRLAAVRDFLKEDDRFVTDTDIWKRNLISLHHRGWLRRVR